MNEDIYYEDDEYYDCDSEGCLFGADCLCPHFFHASSECFTVEMAEAWNDEAADA